MTFLKSKIIDKAMGKIHRNLDKLYDRKLNVETTKVVKISGLNTTVDFTEYEIDELYSATPSLLFKALHWPVTSKDKRNATYVDVGCGKGRALMQGMKYGFKTLIGVEFIPSLAEHARYNLEHAKSAPASNIECNVVCQDIRNYKYPDTDLVLYLFNPFDPVVFRGFLDNLLEDLQNSPRQATLIYYHSHCSQMLEDCDFLERIDYGYLARATLKILSTHTYGAWRFKLAGTRISQ